MKKFNQKKAVDSAAKTVGITAGMMAGGAISNVIPLPDKRISQGILLAGGVVLSSMIGGKSKNSKMLKSVAEGIAARGAFDLAASVIPSSNDDGLVGRMQNGALGLGCSSCSGGLGAELALPARTPVVTWDEDNSDSYSGLANVQSDFVLP